MNKRNLALSVTGLLVAGTGFKVYKRYQDTISTAYKKISSGSRVILTQYGTMEFTESGAGAPILVIHGIGGGYDHGILIGNLIQDQFRIIAPSRFGYLRSMLPAEPSLTAQAGVYAAILDELGLPGASILGISAGGLSAIQFALSYPERCHSLVLLSAVTRNYPQAVRQYNGFYDLAYRMDFVGWSLINLLRPVIRKIRSVSKDSLAPSPEESEWVESFYLAALPTSRRYAGAMNDINQIGSGSEPPLGQLNRPTLIIHASDDLTVPVEHAWYASRQIPDAHLEILPDGGHMMLGHHSQVKRLVTGFLHQYERS